MKKIAIIIVLFCTTMGQIQAQTFEDEVKRISNKIDRITNQQKDSLKMKVKEINLQLEEGKISKTKADELKKEAAIYHAQRIEVLVAAQEKKLQRLVQDKVDGKILGEDRYMKKVLSLLEVEPFSCALPMKIIGNEKRVEKDVGNDVGLEEPQVSSFLPWEPTIFW